MTAETSTYCMDSYRYRNTLVRFTSASEAAQTGPGPSQYQKDDDGGRQ